MNVFTAKRIPVLIPLLVFATSIGMGMMVGGADLNLQKQTEVFSYTSQPHDAVVLQQSPLSFAFTPHEQVYLPQVQGVETQAFPTVRPTIKPSVTPTVTPNYARCRKDCTLESCGTGLTCMAFANDEGMYTYQCVNPLCAPSQQDDECKCMIIPSPTRSIIKK